MKWRRSRNREEADTAGTERARAERERSERALAQAKAELAAARQAVTTPLEQMDPDVFADAIRQIIIGGSR